MSTPSREIFGAALVAVLLAGVSMHAMAQVQSLSSALEAQELTSPPPLPTNQTYDTHQERVQAVKDYQQAVPHDGAASDGAFKVANGGSAQW